MTTQAFYVDMHRLWFPTSSQITIPYRMKRSWEILSELKPVRLLDVGFEDIQVTRVMQRFVQPLDITLVDIDFMRVGGAKAAGYKAFECDVSQSPLPFPDRTFDVVYMSEVIEHLVDPDYAIQELSRVLMPNGRIVMTTPNLASWYNRLLLMIGILPVNAEVSTKRIMGRGFVRLGQGKRPVGHLRLFTCQALRELLSSSGLKIERLEGYSDDRVPFDAFFRGVPSLSSGMIVVASHLSK